MKKLLLILCLGFISQIFGQKKYSFDYALVYQEQCQKHEKLNEVVYLINSKMNQYKLYVHPKDSASVSLHFTDKNGVSVHRDLYKTDFYKAETFTNDCSQTFRYNRIVKKNYKIKTCNDTIIHDTTYYHYKIFSLKSLRYQKRNNIVTAHFIIPKKNSLDYNFPMYSLVFTMDSDAIEIPKGIAKMIYFLNTEGKITEKLELKGIIKSDRFLTIPESCDYTNEEIRNYMPKVTFGR